jgi:transposase-like protein
MSKIKLSEPELLVEFIAEQSQYSPDFRALVLRIYTENQGDISQTCALCCISERTLRLWIDSWNSDETDKKKV